MVDAGDGGPPVHVHPIPFLEPLALRRRIASEETVDSPRFGHHEAMAWAMDRVRHALSGGGSGASRSVVLAHTYVTGGDPTDSERDLSIGHVEHVARAVFDGVDVVALGHLHRRQSFDDGRVAYSGSPLPYSFSEERDVKSVRLVDLAPDGTCTEQLVPLGVGRPLRTVTGTLDGLLTDPSLADAEGAWVRAVLTDERLPIEAMTRLRARFAHAVELSHRPEGARPREEGPGSTTQVRAADPLELSLEFLQDRRGVPADDAERELLADAVVAAAGERPAVAAAGGAS